jgi:FkbM family methyltransferase
VNNFINKLKFYLKRFPNLKRILRYIYNIPNRFKTFFYRRNKNFEIKSKLILGLKIFYRENTADEKVLSHSFENDIFLPVINQHYNFNQDDIVFDIGAHIGTFSILISKYLKDGKIYSFEASKETFNLLSKNVNENNLLNILPLNNAVLESTSEVKLFKSASGNWGDSIFLKGHRDFELVQAIDLNSFIALNQIKKIDFIKFNAEGAEFPILLNLSTENFSIIKNMLILYHLDLNKKFNLENLVKNLRNHNFEISFYNRSEKRGWIFAKKLLN